MIDESLMREGGEFASKMAALVKEIQNRLPGRPVEIVPGSEKPEWDADWIVYVRLDDDFEKDLAEIDWLHEEYLPRQGVDFNQKIVLMPL